MDLEFRSLKELYNHIKPALEAKVSEMKRLGFNYIKSEDIWNYLKENKWKSASGLALHEMINDVLNTDNVLIDKYFKEKMGSSNRTINLEEGEYNG